MNIRSFRNKTPKLGKNVFVDESATVIGDVILGDDVSVWPMAVIRGDMNNITIGNRSNVQDGSILHVMPNCDYYPGGFPIKMGDDVVVAHGVNLHGCTIGNRCLIGIGSIILDGAVLEDEVMIGAGSLVSPGKRLESGYLYFGSPVKKHRKITQKERDSFQFLIQEYLQLKQSY